MISMNHRYFTNPAVPVSDTCVSDTSILRYSDTLSILALCRFLNSRIAVSPYPYRVSVIHSFSHVVNAKDPVKKLLEMFSTCRCCPGVDDGSSSRLPPRRLKLTSRETMLLEE